MIYMKELVISSNEPLKFSQEKSNGNLWWQVAIEGWKIKKEL